MRDSKFWRECHLLAPIVGFSHSEETLAVTFLPDLRFKRCTLQNLEYTTVGDLVTLVCKSHLTTGLVVLVEFFETPLS